MTVYYCDCCKQEVKDRFYTIPVHVHIKNENPLMGHVTKIGNEMHHVSGRTENSDLCLVCYNKVMYPLWDSIKKITVER